MTREVLKAHFVSYTFSLFMSKYVEIFRKGEYVEEIA